MIESAIETLTSPSSFAEPSLLARWRELAEASPSLDRTFQSPAWFDHARQNPGGRPLAGALVVRRHGPTVDAVVPIVKDHDLIEFVVGPKTLHQVKLSAAIVLGSQPLAPADLAAHDAVLGAIDGWARECAAVVLPSVPHESFVTRWLDESRLVRDRFWVYKPVDPGTGKIFVSDFPATFDAYKAGLDKKRRQNFERKVRVLDKQGKPGKLRRFVAPGEVAEFLSLARPIAQKSWQRGIGVDPFPRDVDWQAKLSDQAARGIFRGYILTCGDEPAAFGVGMFGEGAFHYRATGYDQDLSALSPGTVLTYLLFGDLIGEGVRQLSFGYGDTPYKRLFCNRDFEASRVILLRRTLHHRALMLAHEAFRGGVERAKALYKKYRPPADEPKKPASDDKE